MSEQDLMGISRRLIEAFNAGDGEAFKKHIAPNGVYEELATGQRVQGADEWVRSWQRWKRALPDAKGTITNALASGNTVVEEITWEGTQSGPLELPGRTIAPTGRRVVARATQVCIFEGDRVRETRHYFDMLGILQQLGAVPQFSKASGG